MSLEGRAIAVKKMEGMVDEFARNMGTKQRSSQRTGNSISWEPPEARQFAVNVDSAWREGNAALAVIVRKRTCGAPSAEMLWTGADRSKRVGGGLGLGVVNQVLDVEEPATSLSRNEIAEIHSTFQGHRFGLWGKQLGVLIGML